MVKFLLPEIRVDLCHRHRVGSLSLFIVNNVLHPFHSRIPAFAIPQRNTRQTVNQNGHCFVVGRCSTEQFPRTFAPYSVRVWNSLPNDVVNSSSIDIFE